MPFFGYSLRNNFRPDLAGLAILVLRLLFPSCLAKQLCKALLDVMF